MCAIEKKWVAFFLATVGKRQGTWKEMMSIWRREEDVWKFFFVNRRRKVTFFFTVCTNLSDILFSEGMRCRTAVSLCFFMVCLMCAARTNAKNLSFSVIFGCLNGKWKNISLVKMENKMKIKIITCQKFTGKILL